ncbi:hypothetical protein MRX96_057052 [Rhipicephalus microplus]
MAESSKGAPKDVPEPKTKPGSVPAAPSTSDRQGQPASMQGAGSKNPTVSGHVTADVKQAGSSEAAPLTSQSHLQETVSSTSSVFTSPPYDDPAKTPTSPFSAVESGVASLESPESPNCISDAERRLADLTVLRGRKLPLSESELPMSPMVERDRRSSKGRRVSIDMMPTIDLISPRSALRSPVTEVNSPTDQMMTIVLPESPPVTSQTAAFNEGGRKASATSVLRSSLLSRRTGSTESQKRAVVCPPVRKIRPSPPAQPRPPTGSDTSLPREQKQPDVRLPGEHEPCFEKVQDSSVGTETTDVRRPSLERPVGRRSSSQRLKPRRSSSLLRRRGSQDSLSQRPSCTVDQLSVSVGKRSVSGGTLTCVMLGFVMVLVALTMYIANHFLKPPIVADRSVCSTDDCVRHALHILRRLNTSVDPCADFGAFVCGGGNGGEAQSGNSGKEPDEQIGSVGEIDPAWRLARSYAYQVNNILGTLHQLVPIKRTSETTLKALAALSLCLQRERKRHSNAFAAFMKQRRLPWPASPSKAIGPFDVVDIILDLSINWRASIWIDVRLWHLKTRPDKGPFVVLDEPGHVPLIRMEQVSTLNAAEYVSAVETMAQFIGEVRNSSDTETPGVLDGVAIDQLKRDETDFRDALLYALREDDSYDMLVPLHMLLSNLDVTLEEWMALLRRYLAPAGLNVTFDTALLILRYPQFKTVTGLLSKISPPRLLNVLGWMFAYSYSWLENADFDDLSNQDGQGHGGFSGNGLFVHVLCFAAVHESFGVALGAALLLHHLPSEERLKVTEIVKATAGAIVETVHGSQSVSSSTKADAEAKILLVASRDLWTPKPLFHLDHLDAMYTNFPSTRAESFYVSWLGCRKALRRSLSNRYHGTVMTAKLMRYGGDVLYLYSLNILLLSIPAVFPPNYLKNGNSIMAYAGLGFQLLRQIVKCVDERGRVLDYDTNKRMKWWEENRMCKIDDAVSLKERKEIKDIFALELVSAVAQTAAASDSKPARLKHLEKLTTTQTFYVSYCSHFCGEIGEQEMCNLAMNSSRFAEAFPCQRRGADPQCLFV